jgi:hypothetical protein
MTLDVGIEEQLRTLVEEHGLQDVFSVLIRVCANKTHPATASGFDREIASRWGKALVLLSRVQPQLNSTVPF